MKKLKRIFLLAVLIIVALALTACGKTEPVNEVSLGDGLPAVEFSVPMSKADGQKLEDFGGEYIMLCAENDAALFQHVVNALIDTTA